MPAPAQRLEAPTFDPDFLESISSYVAVTCRRYRVKPADVFDVVQEALTKIVASAGSYRSEKGTFDTWARGVALNVIRRHLRDAKRYDDRFSGHAVNIDDFATREPSPERCTQRKQARCSISNAMGKLTAQQASVVVLFDIDDLSYSEIGNELGITEAAGHKCHERAHKSLFRCLDRELLSVMPLHLAGCDEPTSSNENGSRWAERSHYAGQIVASIIAFLALIPSCFEPKIHESESGDARVLGSAQNAVMYRSDERPKGHDEPAVLRDVPDVKPVPAPLPSVRAVSSPAKVGDKPTYVQDLAPLPPYKHIPNALDHRLPGR